MIRRLPLAVLAVVALAPLDVRAIPVGGAGTAVDSSTVKATGSTTRRKLADRAADVVNVKDFGAKGDGVADDAAAINAAISARCLHGGRVVIPAGRYLIGSELVVDGCKGVTIEGGGRYGTSTTAYGGTQVVGTNAAAHLLHVKTTTSNTVGLTVRDLTLVGAGTVGTGHGILVDPSGTNQVQWTTIERVDITTVPGDGVRLLGGSGAGVPITWQTTLNHVRVIVTGGHGLAAIGWVEQLTALQPYMDAIGGNAWHFDGGATSQVYNVRLLNPIVGACGWSFSLTNTTTVHVDQPYTDGAQRTGTFYLSGTHETWLTGPGHTNVAGTAEGVFLDGASNTAVTVDLPGMRAMGTKKLLNLNAGTIAGLRLGWHYNGVPFGPSDWQAGPGAQSASVAYAAWVPGAGGTLTFDNATDAAYTPVRLRAGATADQAVGFSFADRAGAAKWLLSKSSANNFELYDFAGATTRIRVTANGGLLLAAPVGSTVTSTAGFGVSGGKLSPPKDDATAQAGAVYQGAGAPLDANGANGDVYLRTDTPGTANQRLYVKVAGVWTGIL